MGKFLLLLVFLIIYLYKASITLNKYFGTATLQNFHKQKKPIRFSVVYSLSKDSVQALGKVFSSVIPIWDLTTAQKARATKATKCKDILKKTVRI
ncbi:MAG: hypothetical protein CL527_11045 [Aequorivita sp.]|nr:hypothetical protein [Aequorivita sp.]MAO49201.1 hypothetical protein [Aequorivita sp.]